MLRKKTSETDPADWFAFAAERLKGADILWREEGITGLGIEALQEAVERYLKGFLEIRLKTHGTSNHRVLREYKPARLTEP